MKSVAGAKGSLYVFGGALKRITQGLPKEFPRVTQAQRCCLGLGRAWVAYANAMGGIWEKGMSLGTFSQYNTLWELSKETADAF